MPRIIEVNRRIIHADLLETVDVQLFLPTDVIGQPVDVGVAKRLECWVSNPDARRHHLPDIFATSEAMSKSLIKKANTPDQFGLMTITAAHVSLKKLDDWFRTLYRHPDGDIVAFEVGVL